MRRAGAGSAPPSPPPPCFYGYSYAEELLSGDAVSILPPALLSVGLNIHTKLLDKGKTGRSLGRVNARSKDDGAKRDKVQRWWGRYLLENASSGLCEWVLFAKARTKYSISFVFSTLSLAYYCSPRKFCK